MKKNFMDPTLGKLQEQKLYSAGKSRIILKSVTKPKSHLSVLPLFQLWLGTPALDKLTLPLLNDTTMYLSAVLNSQYKAVASDVQDDATTVMKLKQMGLITPQLLMAFMLHLIVLQHEYKTDLFQRQFFFFLSFCPSNK